MTLDQKQDEEKNSSGLTRRQLLKASGLAGTVLGSAGLGLLGYQSGKDPSTYTGNESFQGAAQTFDRNRFAVDVPHYEKIGPTQRVDARTEVVFSRVSRLRRGWDEEKGVEGLDDQLREYYARVPEDLETDVHLIEEIFPIHREEAERHHGEFLLAEAWSNAMGEVWPDAVDTPPEESDVPSGSHGEPAEPLKMKSPEKTAVLIKKIAYQLGSVLVGITKLNPDWVYSHAMRGRGFDPEQPLEIPKHWEYAIVVGTPMSWDPMYANPNYGTSLDAYSKTRIVALRLTSFIKQLGYPARPHVPGTEYDLMVPPVVIDAGLGEQGRHGVVITPELGSNFRPAVITTNLPMKVDKPIEFGVQDFCRTCKICAENCPSGSISTGKREEVRGYRRYKIDSAKCHSFWFSNLGNLGCRICVAVCPYTRKSNWLHRTALKVSSNDPTGLSHTILTQMQKSFYPAPDPRDYYVPLLGGKNESYRKPPWWLKTEDFIDL